MESQQSKAEEAPTVSLFPMFLFGGAFLVMLVYLLIATTALSNALADSANSALGYGTTAQPYDRAQPEASSSYGDFGSICINPSDAPLSKGAIQ